MRKILKLDAERGIVEAQAGIRAVGRFGDKRAERGNFGAEPA
jgi:hypothetical protein